MFLIAISTNKILSVDINFKLHKELSFCFYYKLLWTCGYTEMAGAQQGTKSFQSGSARSHST